MAGELRDHRLAYVTSKQAARINCELKSDASQFQEISFANG